MTTSLPSPRKERGAGAFVAAIVFNALFLLVAHAHDVWRPWLGGVVTPAYADVLWTVNLGAAVQILGNALLLSRVSFLRHRVVDFAVAVSGLIGAVVFLRVFPLDLARFGAGAEVVARVLLVLGVLGASVAVLVAVVRLAVGANPPASPRPSHP